MKVFSACGFEGAKIGAIAKEAGIGKGTVYEYFESKENLLQEMIKYEILQYRIGLESNIAEGQSINEKLLNYSIFNACFLKDNLDMLQMLLQVNVCSGDMRKLLFEEQTAIIRIMTQMIEEALEKGELRQDVSPELAALLILGMVDQYSKQKVFMEQRPLGELNHQVVVDIILRGIQ